MKKIITLSELKKYSNELSRKKSVIVGGCFDLLHYGHLTFLKKAKKKGDLLIVALESDEFIRQRKKRNPIHTQEQRAEILSSCQYVDLIIKLPLFRSNKEYSDLVKTVKPSVIAVTEGDGQIENKKAQAETVNAKVVVVTDPLGGFSSSNIIKVLNFEL